MKKRGITIEQAEQIRLKKGLDAGAKLRQLRVKKGYTQKEFAELTEVSLLTLQKYEQKKLNIDSANVYTLCKFCVALGCRISDIIEDEELLKKYNEVK